MVRVQVNDLVSAVGVLQNATPTQHSGPAASASVVDASAGAAAGADIDPLWPNGGWPVGGMPATTRVFGGTGGDGGFGGGGAGGPTGGCGCGGAGPGGPSGGSFGRRWSLYDEKYVLSGKGMYNSKVPQSWLQDLRDYLAGRSADLDAILSWTEMQTSEIELAPSQGSGGFPLFDQIAVDPKEVARQLCAFWGPLVASDSNKSSTFNNVV